LTHFLAPWAVLHHYIIAKQI